MHCVLKFDGEVALAVEVAGEIVDLGAVLAAEGLVVLPAAEEARVVLLGIALWQNKVSRSLKPMLNIFRIFRFMTFRC
jgi:hypothetical protein